MKFQCLYQLGVRWLVRWQASSVFTVGDARNVFSILLMHDLQKIQNVYTSKAILAQIRVQYLSQKGREKIMTTNQPVSSTYYLVRLYPMDGAPLKNLNVLLMCTVFQCFILLCEVKKTQISPHSRMKFVRVSTSLTLKNFLHTLYPCSHSKK